MAWRRGKRTKYPDGTIRIGGQYAGRVGTPPTQQNLPPTLPTPSTAIPVSPQHTASRITDTIVNIAQTAHVSLTAAELDGIANTDPTHPTLHTALHTMTPSERAHLADTSQSVNLLSILADDDDSEVRTIACKNSLCPPHTFEKAAYRGEGDTYDTMFGGGFADTKSETLVRAVIASRSDTPQPLLHRLSRDPDPSVREAAAANSRTLADDLDALSRDDNPKVRHNVAKNLNTRTSTLETMLTAGTENIAILQNPNAPKSYIRKTVKQVRKDSRLPFTAENFIRVSLAKTQMGALAHNPNLPQWARILLGEDNLEQARKNFPN